MKDELEGMLKEAVVAYLKVLLQNLPGETEQSASLSQIRSVTPELTFPAVEESKMLQFFILYNNGV
jgi:hypothetical protein